MNSSISRHQLWISALRQRSVWKRAATLGLSVGALQAAINQGDHWITGAISPGVIAKTIISPLVGLGLALASAAGTWVDRQTTPIEP